MEHPTGAGDALQGAPWGKLAMLAAKLRDLGAILSNVAKRAPATLPLVHIGFQLQIHDEIMLAAQVYCRFHFRASLIN
jgi:hypothetical protein